MHLSHIIIGGAVVVITLDWLYSRYSATVNSVESDAANDVQKVEAAVNTDAKDVAVDAKDVVADLDKHL